MLIHQLLMSSAAILVAIALIATACLSDPTRQTSLKEAWRWGLAAQLAWLVSCLISVFATSGSPLLDQFWLWTAILTLCPFISALGARRPGSRVWTCFIILPLLAVLGWPGFTVLSTWSQLAPLKVQAPVCVGFALVTVMGTGNYLGTRYSLSAVFAALAVVLSLTPLTTLVELNRDTTLLFRATAAMLFAVAVLNAIRQGFREGAEDSRFDKLWFDFRDSFGIVWSIRIQDRLNEIAEKEGWCCRLGSMGFEWELRTSPASREATETKLEHALRWHLRRFVDPAWIDQRLNSGTILSDSLPDHPSKLE